MNLIASTTVLEQCAINDEVPSVTVLVDAFKGHLSYCLRDNGRHVNILSVVTVKTGVLHRNIIHPSLR